MFMGKILKSKAFWIIFFVVLIIIAGVVLFDGSNNNGAGSKIQIVEEKFITDYRGFNNLNNNYFCPIVDCTIKNVSSNSVSVFYDVNFYCEGQLICSATSKMITLGSGDTYSLWVQGRTGVRWGNTKTWSYEITDWHVY